LEILAKIIRGDGTQPTVNQGTGAQNEEVDNKDDEEKKVEVEETEAKEV
jgi:hypothetical protein